MKKKAHSANMQMICLIFKLLKKVVEVWSHPNKNAIEHGFILISLLVIYIYMTC